jgi:hypothetical protein
MIGLLAGDQLHFTSTKAQPYRRQTSELSNTTYRTLQQGRVFPTIRDVLPRWASRHELYTGTSNSIKGSGWPLLVLSASIYRMHGLNSPGYEVFGGIQTPLEPFTYGGLTLPKGFAMPPDVIPRVLPLRPIWPGFVVNTLFYAAILWLLICGPFAVRRVIRIRRGLCPACAYPRGEAAVCSECGNLVVTGCTSFFGWATAAPNTSADDTNKKG